MYFIYLQVLNCTFPLIVNCDIVNVVPAGMLKLMFLVESAKVSSMDFSLIAPKITLIINHLSLINYVGD